MAGYTAAHDKRMEPRVDLNTATVWWILAGALVAVELVTGSFYLLMLAIGAAAGALAAHAGMGLSPQVVAFALVGGGAVAAWHFKRSKLPGAEPAERNRDVNLDIGQAVQVAAWNADGTARVTYRGSAWLVRIAAGAAALPGPHVIVAVQGSELQVAPTPSPNR
jgi:membrane protein implicated in regulation of membrane protease activity